MEEKVFYNPGDKVKNRHFKNSPEMVVVEKVTKLYIKRDPNESPESVFIGIKCQWFDTENRIQEHVFFTKDLVHIN